MRAALPALALLAVLALATAAPAGAEVPGCTDVHRLPPQGYLALCVLAYQDHAGDTWRTVNNYPLYVFFYDYLPSSAGYLQAHGVLAQQTATAAWGHGTYQNYGTYAGGWAVAWFGPVVVLSSGAQAGQAGYEQTGAWPANHETTYAYAGWFARVPFVGAYGFVRYEQVDANGQGCHERLQLTVELAGFPRTVDLVPWRPCTYTVERLPELPHL